MRGTENAVLLGDEGYGLAPWLMVPYKDPTTEAEREFNRLHKSERAIIKRCFGQMKKRFPMMQYTVRVGTQKLARFILCAFILHNVAKYLNDQDNFEDPNGDSRVGRKEWGEVSHVTASTAGGLTSFP
uniref:Putative nuclease HARBI1 n=1 Tax=Lygus hesperus TaxID=30085 RepID=A0A0A9WBB0_LYGHE